MGQDGATEENEGKKSDREAAEHPLPGAAGAARGSFPVTGKGAAARNLNLIPGPPAPGGLGMLSPSSDLRGIFCLAAVLNSLKTFCAGRGVGSRWQRNRKDWPLWTAGEPLRR